VLKPHVCSLSDRIGAGESGKSTILKQMRIIYSEGFHLEERKEIRQVIFSNMIVAFKIVAEEMREFNQEYQYPESEVMHCDGGILESRH